MCNGAKCMAARKLLQNLRRDDLMDAKVGPAVHDAMADRYRCGVNMLPDRVSQSGESIALRLE